MTFIVLHFADRFIDLITKSMKTTGFSYLLLHSICSDVLFWLKYKKNKRALQVALVVENPPANVGDTRDLGLIPGSGRSPGGGHGNPLLPGELHGQRSLVGYSPRGRSLM